MAFMIINRTIEGGILENLRNSNKGVILYGARQIGKTTLSNKIISTLGLKTLKINGDQNLYLDILSSRDVSKITNLINDYEMLFIDEAQRIPEIGINLKIILDTFPGIKVLVTGSSALDLQSKISEPLTGRIWSYKLYPISIQELKPLYNPIEIESLLEERLIYGSYPEVFNMLGSNQKRDYLQNLSDAYLYKDLLELGDVRNTSKIRDLLKLLAFQIGSQVSLSELGNTLDMGKDTVARYIDLLEKSFVVFRLTGFSRNLRNEVGKMNKIYFYDLGIRNVLIDNLKPIVDRNDLGQLWENFLIIERFKKLTNTKDLFSHYFWRLSSGAELDLVEEKEGFLYGFEFKYSSKKRARAPKSWIGTYPGSSFQVINKDNWLEFVK